MTYNQQGNINTGSVYIIVIMFILIAVAYMVSGPTPSRSVVPDGIEVEPGKPVQESAKDHMQLYSFAGATITPPVGSQCEPGGINTNPGLIIAYSPIHGRAVSTKGQIKIWLNDTAPVKISTNESIARSNGIITQPGDRTFLAQDGLTYEPAIYIFPNTVGSGGTAFFPAIIHGSYNNGAGNRIAYGGGQPPASVVITDKGHSTQVVWNVSDLGLGPGAYQLQFVIHDGNEGRAIGCIALRIYEIGDTRNILPL